MAHASKIIVTSLLALVAAAPAVPAAAPTGVVDQDNTAHDNAGWNLGAYKVFEQTVQVGIDGRLEGFLFRFSASIFATLPVSIYVGPGPHSSTDIPAWTGKGFDLSGTSSENNLYMDCSAATLNFKKNDLLTIRIGDGINFHSGMTLTGNANISGGLPFYSQPLHIDGVAQAFAGLYFKTYMLPCQGAATGYGQGCPGLGGIVPKLSMAGCPKAGSFVSLDISNAAGGAPGVLVASNAQANVKLGASSCRLLVNPILGVVTFPISGQGAGGGSVAITGLVPGSAAGTTTYWQLFVQDGSTSLGGSASNGLEIFVAP